MLSALGALTVLVTSLLALSVLSTLFMPAASAHAGLVSIDPADGSTVTDAPTRVVLTFDEQVTTPAVVVVTGPDGRKVSSDRTRVVGTIVAVDTDLSAPGRYTVAFRVVSADGHPVAKQTSFAFVPPGATPPPPLTANTPGDGSGSSSALEAVVVVGIGVTLTVLIGVGLVRAMRANAGDEAAP